MVTGAERTGELLQSKSQVFKAMAETRFVFCHVISTAEKDVAFSTGGCFPLRSLANGRSCRKWSLSEMPEKQGRHMA